MTNAEIVSLALARIAAIEPVQRYEAPLLWLTPNDKPVWRWSYRQNRWWRRSCLRFV